MKKWVIKNLASDDYLAWQEPVWDDSGYFWTSKNNLEELQANSVDNHKFIFDSEEKAEHFAVYSGVVYKDCELVEIYMSEEVPDGSIYKLKTDMYFYSGISADVYSVDSDSIAKHRFNVKTAVTPINRIYDVYGEHVDPYERLWVYKYNMVKKSNGNEIIVYHCFFDIAIKPTVHVKEEEIKVYWLKNTPNEACDFFEIFGHIDMYIDYESPFIRYRNIRQNVIIREIYSKEKDLLNKSHVYANAFDVFEKAIGEGYKIKIQ